MAGMAIYICDCMGLVSEHVETRSLEELARSLESVTLVERVGALCRRQDLSRMAARLTGAGVDRLLVAACSPRMSLQLPEERLDKAAGQGGIDPRRVEVANIREQCAWVHRGNIEGATRKARDLLRMAHARLSASEPALEPVALERRALVLGAGPAGLAAARSIARAGIEVLLVEQQAYVGGTLCRLPFMFQTECWPATCESSCIGPVQAAEAEIFDPDLRGQAEAHQASIHGMSNAIVRGQATSNTRHQDLGSRIHHGARRLALHSIQKTPYYSWEETAISRRGKQWEISATCSQKGGRPCT